MTFKQFLKPDWRKIVIFGVLFLLFSLMSYVISGSFTDVLPFIGFPSIFYRFGGMTMVGYYRSSEFYLFNLLFDIIFWYLLPCLIIWIYDKVKKKP